MAADRLQVFECEICGNMVEVMRGGKGELVCCGQPMKLLEENTTGEGEEKHVPIIESADGGVLVKVGSVEHVMQDDHFIEWIEVLTENATHVAFLVPDIKPEARFAIGPEEITAAREHCNVHGLWTS
jgi:superoxide reductase